ncbi:MAG: hypothetical protein HOQ24_00125 [Mycobacteriaceae bacterium]|nr:hypothetical protein [Mycobacteriaceae bacterium]
MTAQQRKLARTLHTAPAELDFLAGVPEADLLAFRRQVADYLFESHAQGLHRIAAATKIVPAALAAKLVGKVRNPVLAAKVAGVLDPGHAVDVAKRLPADFLAEVAAHLDTARSERIIGKLPVSLITDVAVRITRRGDWLTLAELVSVVPDDAAKRTLEALDPEALVRSGPLVDETEHERLVALISPAKIAEMLRVTAELDLWDELRPTTAALPESGKAAARTAAEQLPPAIRDKALSELT